MIRSAFFALVFSACATMPARPAVDARFDVIVLGGSGGLVEGDLTAILVSRADRTEYIALDLGTLYGGLQRASLPAFSGSKWNDAGELLKHHLHGAFISHPHLDHVAGLVIGSPELTKLNVYGLGSTVEALRTHAFGSALWANFTDEGPGAIGRIHLTELTPGTPVSIDAPGLKVEAIPLSHAGVTSTAFLVESDDAALLYLGDTGPDAVEGRGRLAALWQRVKPLVASGRLRAIFVEASFPDPRDEKLLFGHLTPKWIMQELESLGPVTLVITHVKPSLERGADARKSVAEQLRPLEQRGVRVLMPEGGQRFGL